MREVGFAQDGAIASITDYKRQSDGSVPPEVIYVSPEKMKEQTREADSWPQKPTEECLSRKTASEEQGVKQQTNG